MKTANEHLKEYSIDTMRLADEFNGQLFAAMERYAEDYHAHHSTSPHTPDLAALFDREADVQPVCTCRDDQKQRPMCPVCDKEEFDKVQDIIKKAKQYSIIHL